MAQLTFDCPHCSTENSGFTGRGGYQIERMSDLSILLLSCNTCHEGIVAKVTHPQIDSWLENAMHQLPKVREVWPKSKDTTTPKHLPENLASFFNQARKCLDRKLWDAAGGMFRKTLDASLKRLHADGSGNLYQRINGLPAESGVTSAMKEWAHEIRLLGNDAMHEEEPFSQEEAVDLAGFTETFLTYAFTMPATLVERLEKASG